MFSLEMESPDPFEACDGDWTPSRFGWLSPRISFSQDFAMLDRVSPEKRKREHAMEDDYSSEFEFSNSMSLDLQPGEVMLSADELFFDGKLRPLQRTPRIGREELPRIGSEESPRIDREELQWAGEDRFEVEHWPMSRHLMSFDENPRCSSMSIEGARRHPRRSCISLNNSRCTSPSRSFSLPPTTPASPKAASKYSSKFKDFFKLKKLQVPTAKELSSSEVVREHAVSSSCRLPISPRSFWPFSRSNSAGESKSTPAVSPTPRRSNSAGESKTSSSSLVPCKINAASEAKVGTYSSGSAKFPVPPTSQAKKGLPPLPNTNGKKSSGGPPHLLPHNRGLDDVALSSESSSLRTPVCPAVSSSALLTAQSIKQPDKDGMLKSGADAANCLRANNRQLDFAGSVNNAGRDHRGIPDAASNATRARGCSSPGRAARRGISSPARNFARGSPGRRGVWNSPGRGNGGRVAMRNLERCNVSPKGLVRPQDSRNREGWKGSERPNCYSTSVRVTPVLNVPVCMGPSLRSGKASSKSKLFSFGSFFSKKDKASKANPTLPPTNSQNGG